MRYLSVIRQKLLTERNQMDTCPLTDSERVHVIDPTISLLSYFLSIWWTHVIAALVMLSQWSVNKTDTQMWNKKEQKCIFKSLNMVYNVET